MIATSLDNVTGWILELDRGQGIPYQGNYSSWLEQKQKRLEIEEKQETARQRSLKHELEWIRSISSRASCKKQGPNLCYESLLADAGEKRAGAAQDFYSPGPRLGSFSNRGE